MFVLALLGMFIYTIGVGCMESSTIVSSQWFKITIWLKSLSLIALFSFFEDKIPVLKKEFFQKICTRGLQFIGVISIVLILNPVSIFKTKTYDFFFLSKKNPEIEIAGIAKEKTPKDALFIVPMNHTHFKNYRFIPIAFPVIFRSIRFRPQYKIDMAMCFHASFYI